MEYFDWYNESSKNAWNNEKIVKIIDTNIPQSQNELITNHPVLLAPKSSTERRKHQFSSSGAEFNFALPYLNGFVTEFSQGTIKCLYVTEGETFFSNGQLITKTKNPDFQDSGYSWEGIQGQESIKSITEIHTSPYYGIISAATIGFYDEIGAVATTSEGEVMLCFRTAAEKCVDLNLWLLMIENPQFLAVSNDTSLLRSCAVSSRFAFSPFREDWAQSLARQGACVIRNCKLTKQFYGGTTTTTDSN
ncbi:MAG: hypothetical protein A3E07_02730 [Candidatus Wildermuthbacteria bacterium RIFCSPHIGHO2_12_FULL_45_9]|uniref:Uncharacterized protein n=1 Tax=Candidatus Wildermuthbacteria bacterium RIFCSPHIGHO2_02_FULL_45_25 TaxID=1802450 RepID=A0A1G2R433_9BACT|nr:MAG: hypothetical protein A2748_02465 [Candidatus Wildermuthbacteria bacterium RIFCSPHIGHO2_01_FULL_45_20]OHA67139.1 MAG: hypothetical protein A3C04_02540 [Candidatus Wildermuthbacteria bacterium RIFCSPHIGHO2_02_FULL_45_25]OHA71425.1 MAG: hypothetical protein A3E07_02730 [Candidatus Wildermuthbacteria bacterium RIFCSPHIGHO2_12_FULL_45_9]